MAELKSCPFCGKVPYIVCADDSYGSAMITCGDDNNCPVDLTAWGDLKSGETLDDAITAWNTRAELTRNTAIVDQLAEAGQELLTWYGPFNPTTHPPEINGAWLRLDQALATYRESVGK